MSLYTKRPFYCFIFNKNLITLFIYAFTPKKKLTIIIYWVLKLNTIKFIKFNYIYFVYTSISFFLFLFLDWDLTNSPIVYIRKQILTPLRHLENSRSLKQADRIYYKAKLLPITGQSKNQYYSTSTTKFGSPSLSIYLTHTNKRWVVPIRMIKTKQDCITKGKELQRKFQTIRVRH